MVTKYDAFSVFVAQKVHSLANKKYAMEFQIDFLFQMFTFKLDKQYPFFFFRSILQRKHLNISKTKCENVFYIFT
jgi:hypothetical protein